MSKQDQAKMNELAARAKKLQELLEAFVTTIDAAIDTLDDEADGAEEVYMDFDSASNAASRAAGCMEEIADKYTII